MIHFHWRVIRVPPALIEYVVAHELVHLREPRHDAAFWTRLENVVPDYCERTKVLVEEGGQSWGRLLRSCPVAQSCRSVAPRGIILTPDDDTPRVA